MPDSPDQQTPEAILASESLSRDRKIEILREMAYDARERAVATEEGMTGSVELPDLAAIRRALEALGARERHDGDAKQ